MVSNQVHVSESSPSVPETGDKHSMNIIMALIGLSLFYYDLTSDALAFRKFWLDGYYYYFGIGLSCRLLTRLIILLVLRKNKYFWTALSSLVFMEPIFEFIAKLWDSKEKERTLEGINNYSIDQTLQHLETQFSTIPSLFITIHAFFYDEKQQASLVLLVSLIGSWVNLAWNQARFRRDLYKIDNLLTSLLDFIWITSLIVAKVVGFGIMNECLQQTSYIHHLFIYASRSYNDYIFLAPVLRACGRPADVPN